VVIGEAQVLTDHDHRVAAQVPREVAGPRCATVLPGLMRPMSRPQPFAGDPVGDVVADAADGCQGKLAGIAGLHLGSMTSVTPSTSVAVRPS
jgi:hypothetical protein